MMAEHVVVLEEAARDLGLGVVFYESQREGLGTYFFDSLMADIESLHLSAGTHPIHVGVYRMLSRRFPYAVYYGYDGKTVRVIAILDMRRNPVWSYDQLNSRPLDR